MARNRERAQEREGDEIVVRTSWSTAQAYTLAVICLGLGVAIGYLLRGSAPVTTAAPANAATAATPSLGPGQIPGFSAVPGTGQDPAMVEKAAAPLEAAVEQNPRDSDALAKLGNLYYDAQQYAKAIQYYERVLEQNPRNADVRTDMGTAYWYSGNPDRAIAEFEKSLTYRPNHPNTMFNLGVVKWQGKKDPQGAIAVWKKLLQANPNYPERQRVEELIAGAEQHGKNRD